MADRYEQKPKSWAIFPMSQDDIREKEDFYHDKGWDLDKVPTHSGKMVLPDGTVVRMEGRVIEGQRGKFFAGSCYIPQGQGSAGTSERRSDRDADDRRSPRDRDDRSSRDDRSRDRDTRRDDRDSRSRPRDDSRRDDRRQPDYDDDVPF